MVSRWFCFSSDPPQKICKHNDFIFDIDAEIRYINLVEKRLILIKEIMNNYNGQDN